MDNNLQRKMDPQNQDRNQHQQEPNPTPRPNPSPSTTILCSLFIILLAVSFGFTKTEFFRTHLLKSTLSSSPHPYNLFHKVSTFLSPHQNPTKIHLQNPHSRPLPCVLWMAPFLSGGGYSSEAWSYILALNKSTSRRRTHDSPFRLSIEQHGDLVSLEFWDGLPIDVKELALRLRQVADCRLNETVVVCHSEPGAWHPPLFDTLPCPPTGYEGFMSVIGRTMFETDRLNNEHVSRCNRMDYVWVPSEFHVSTFVNSGVDPSKVVKVVQPVDVEFFDPAKYEPLELAGDLVLGGRKGDGGSGFVFLSVFKWEYRKGWDVLLEAYLKEFSAEDGVALYLLTNPYHSDRDFGNKIAEFVEDSDMTKPDEGWAPVYVIDAHIAQVDLPRLYKAADAFVLPSRGEGWGRPLVEAMSMSLPVIATNWSGPTEFLTGGNGYPVMVDRMVEVMEGPFKGHNWAEPSLENLRVRMRHVMSNVEEARSKGRKAREDMIRRFSPEIVAEIVASHLRTIIDRSKLGPHGSIQ